MFPFSFCHFVSYKNNTIKIKPNTIIDFTADNSLDIDQYDGDERAIAKELKNRNCIRKTEFENTRRDFSKAVFLRRLVKIIVNIYLTKEERQQTPSTDAVETGFRQSVVTVNNHLGNIRSLKYRTNRIILELVGKNCVIAPHIFTNMYIPCFFDNLGQVVAFRGAFRLLP